MEGLGSIIESVHGADILFPLRNDKSVVGSSEGNCRCTAGVGPGSPYEDRSTTRKAFATVTHSADDDGRLGSIIVGNMVFRTCAILGRRFVLCRKNMITSYSLKLCCRLLVLRRFFQL